MAYLIRTMQPEDRAQVLRLWEQIAHDARAATELEGRYSWLYERNPRGRPITIVACTEKGHHVVGCGSAYTRRVSVAGEKVDAAVMADFVVDRRHRMGGAALMIQRALVAAQPPATAALVAYPNQASMAVFKRIGYQPIGAAQCWVKPLRSAYKLRQYVPHDAVARVAAIPVDTLLATRDATRAFGAPERTVRILDRADERFDQLWHRNAPAYPLTSERSSEYLNWRYADVTTSGYRFFSVFGQSGELVSYLVFSVAKSKAFVVDAFAADMCKTMEDMLVRFSRAMRQEGHESIFMQFVGDEEFGDRLKRLGFYKREELRRPMFAMMLNSNLPDTTTLLQCGGWYWFDGEIDI
jgi:hypothetical protein